MIKNSHRLLRDIDESVQKQIRLLTLAAQRNPRPRLPVRQSPPSEQQENPPPKTSTPKSPNDDQDDDENSAESVGLP